MATIQEVLEIGLQHHHAGRLQEAEAIYRQILQVQSNHPDALHLLGVVAHQIGRHDTAVEYISRAIRLYPKMPDYYNNLGLALQSQGNPGEAAAQYLHAVELNPTYAEAYLNLGNTLKERGQFNEAVERYRTAICLKPDFAEAHMNLGGILQELGRLDEAETHCRQALAIKPSSSEAYNNLANVLQGQGKLDEAVACYQRALALKPDFAEAHYNLGTLLKDQGRLQEAAAQYRQALELKPGYAAAYNNLGIALRGLGYLEKAVACYQKALAGKPDFAEAHNNLGLVLFEKGKFQEAMGHFRRALALKADYVEAENLLVHLSQHLCEWSGFDMLFARQRELIYARPSAGIPPFTVVSIPSSADEQLSCARNWVRNRFGPFAKLREKLGFNFARTPKAKLRVGYLSADFCEHAVAHLIAEVFELHDRNAFQVSAYSYGPDDKSEIRRRLADSCERFVDIAHLPFVKAASRIHEDRIDVLVDLMGYTKGARTQIAALRPAPIQVNYLGYPGTMGADFIDYIVTDRFITPPEQERFFSEKCVYLPDCYQANDRKRPIAEKTPSRAECGLPGKGFIFCCFNNTYKITPAVFDVWMRVLKEIPGSVAWLLEANSAAAANLRREAVARGVEPERLVFAPKLPMEQHLARFRIADLFLDTLPYNAHVTASDALWAGLPVLTCAGETFASRVAGSLLTAIGLPELITHSLADYEVMAVRLARKPSEVARLRKRLEKNRLTAPLFDSERFTRHLEKAYRRMWEIYCRGEAPRRIEVSDEGLGKRTEKAVKPKTEKKVKRQNKR